MLAAVGLETFIAQTVEQYKSIAIELANDVKRLGELRGSMRERMRRSALMDEKGFARDWGDAVLSCVRASAI